MRLTVVLIDDDADDIEVMQDAITTIDSQVICIPFTHAVQAVKALTDPHKRFVPNYIFLDYNMPEMMGTDCLKVFRSMKDLDSTKIVVISTGLNEEDAKLFKSLGADFAFRKPVELSGYGKILRAVLGL